MALQLARLYEMLGNDFLYAHPEDHVIFPDNHDMSRVHTQLGDDVRKTRLAAYFFATMRGIPQFYYGTEILMSNTGDDSHGNIRSDFPGGWDADGDDVNGFEAIGLTEEARPSGGVQNAAGIGGVLPQRCIRARSSITCRSLVAMCISESRQIKPLWSSSTKGMLPEKLELARFDEVLHGRRGLVDALTGETLNSGETLNVPGWKRHGCWR